MPRTPDETLDESGTRKNRSSRSADCSNTRRPTPRSAIRRSTRTSARRRLGRADLHRLVDAQRERARARALASRDLANRDAQRRSVLQSVSGLGGSAGAAPHTGLRTHALPGDPLEGSTYELNGKEREKRRILTLPKSLRQAMVELDRDAIVRGSLGDHIYHAFRDAKPPSTSATAGRSIPGKGRPTSGSISRSSVPQTTRPGSLRNAGAQPIDSV